MAHPHMYSRPLSGRVYRAIFSQALPYVVYAALAGAIFGAFLGALASMLSLGTMNIPLLVLYTSAGVIIGTAVAIRPVFHELLAFHWSADVLGK